MVQRDIYSEPEKLMLESEARRFDAIAGWHQSKRPMVATEESLRRLGLGVDPWNPLWHDDTYAQQTRWGKILAYPTYLGFFGETGIMTLHAPPECGQQYMIWMGEDYDFQRPVVAGEAFSVYQHRPSIVDVTPIGGNSPRTFGLMEGDLEYFDEDKRPLGRLRNYVQRTFQSEPPTIHPMPEYAYTKEEIQHLGKLMQAEEIRGKTPRHFEDVHVGDELVPIVTGPTTMGSNSLVSAITPDLGDFFMHTRHFYLESLRDPLGPEFIPDPSDPKSGRYLILGGPMGRHYSDLAAQAEGEPCAWLFGVVSRFSLLRVITNWMGDDGVLRRFCWRHMTRTRVGDAMTGHAVVVGKRTEVGENLVDLHVWLRNLRGNVSEAAVATVSLPTRGAANTSAGTRTPVAAMPATTAEVSIDVTGPVPPREVSHAPFEQGARVRVKSPSEWPSPPGFRFAGAVGTTTKWVQYDEAMRDFQDVVVCMRFEEAEGEAQQYVGSSLLFRPSDLEPA